MSRRRSAGFTLLELTVSLTISALAVASLAHVVHDAAKLDTRVSERSRSAGEAEALFSLLEQLLADPQRGLSGEALRLAGGSSHSSVYGNAQTITVVSRGLRVLGLADPTAFTLSFEAGPSPDRGRLLLDWASIGGSAEPEVVARARGFTLRYASVTRGGELAWTRDWLGSVEALALIEASYVEAVSERQIVRIIPVGAVMPRICVVQPLLGGCPEWR